MSVPSNGAAFSESKETRSPQSGAQSDSAPSKVAAPEERSQGDADMAKELLRDAEAEAERLKAEARRQGFELGYNEGSAEGALRFESLTAEHAESFSSVLAELKHAGDTMVSDMESDMIDLCFSVLRKVAALDRTTDGEIFKSIIKKAMSQVDLTGKVSIRLSHEDFDRFFPNGEAIFDINDTAVTAAVVSDPEFSGGDIAVDTDSETVLAGADTQFRNIEIAFRHRIGNGQWDE